MAYENFIPQIWSEAIQRELEGSYVFAEDCNRQWEGDVKKKGDTVHILGVRKPEIKTMQRDEADETIDDPETVGTTDTQLVIDQIRYFNYMVGDIDKAQAVGGLMDALSKETSEGLADAVDTDIAALAAHADVTNTVAAASVTKDNILGFIDSAIEKLYEKKVRNSTELVLTISPRFYTLFKQAYIKLDTNNHEMIKNGRVAQYGNVTVKMSTNVHKESDADHIMLRTKRAIAFAQPLTHIEPYRPEKKFADAVKGFILYGTKIVRPDEIVTIRATY